MAYISTIKQQDYRISLQTEDALKHLTLNEQTFTIDWRQLASLPHSSASIPSEGGRYTLVVGGQSYEVFVRRIQKSDERDSRTYEIMLAGQRFEVTAEDERSRLLSSVARTAASGNAKVQAPMPGLVVNVLVQVGESVEVGQTVTVLEAMKMENDLSSPIAGTIKEVKVQKGQAVEQGETLVVIEAMKA